MTGSAKTHTLSVLVEDKPGVLARIAALFSRRGFNIESLAVGATEQKDMSRMTIVVSAEETPLEQITKQLNKLINVIKIIEQDDDKSVARELALIKVRADAGTRSQVIEAVNLFRAKVIDVSPESLRRLRDKAAEAGLAERVRAVEADLDDAVSRVESLSDGTTLDGPVQRLSLDSAAVPALRRHRSRHPLPRRSSVRSRSRRRL